MEYFFYDLVIRYEATRYEATRYEATCYDATRYEATRYEATRYEATRYEATRYEATRWGGIPPKPSRLLLLGGVDPPQLSKSPVAAAAGFGGYTPPQSLW